MPLASICYIQAVLSGVLAIVNCPMVIKLGPMEGVAGGPPHMEQLRGKGEIQSR